MSTLLLRSVAPMQSWGVQSRFSVRDTGMEPSKSGIIGLLCAALGRSREAGLQDLTSLRMGVRVDRKGRVEWDYQIAQNVLKAQGGLKVSETSRRYYIADAAFLVGLEGNLELLRSLFRALQRPHWSLYLGRKPFCPSEPIWMKDGLKVHLDLESALREYPLLDERHGDPKRELMKIVIDDPSGVDVRSDMPLSFSERTFIPRRVKTDFISPPPIILPENRL